MVNMRDSREHPVFAVVELSGGNPWRGPIRPACQSSSATPGFFSIVIIKGEKELSEQMFGASLVRRIIACAVWWKVQSISLN